MGARDGVQHPPDEPYVYPRPLHGALCATGGEDRVQLKRHQKLHSFVNVNDFRQQGQNWDAHFKVFNQHRTHLLPLADQSRAVLLAGRARGLGLRVHANQLGHGPGVQLAVEMEAASADHCTYLSDHDIDALSGSNTVATFLPAADFSTRSPYPDARRAIDAGVAVALATNCNPGSSNTTSMSFVVALAVRELHMTADEALQAATIGGAVALQQRDVGVLAPGYRADLVVLDAPSHTHLAYRPGVPLVWKVICSDRQGGEQPMAMAGQ